MISALHASITILRAGSQRPIEIHMHPLDLEMVRRTYLPDAPPNRIEGFLLLGCPVIPDDAMTRGLPQAFTV